MNISWQREVQAIPGDKDKTESKNVEMEKKANLHLQ